MARTDARVTFMFIPSRNDVAWPSSKRIEISRDKRADRFATFRPGAWEYPARLFRSGTPSVSMVGPSRSIVTIARTKCSSVDRMLQGIYPHLNRRIDARYRLDRISPLDDWRPPPMFVA